MKDERLRPAVLIRGLSSVVGGVSRDGGVQVRRTCLALVCIPAAKTERSPSNLSNLIVVDVVPHELLILATTRAVVTVESHLAIAIRSVRERRIRSAVRVPKRFRHRRRFLATIKFCVRHPVIRRITHLAILRDGRARCQVAESDCLHSRYAEGTCGDVSCLARFWRFWLNAALAMRLFQRTSSLHPRLCVDSEPRLRGVREFDKAAHEQRVRLTAPHERGVLFIKTKRRGAVRSSSCGNPQLKFARTLGLRFCIRSRDSLPHSS